MILCCIYSKRKRQIIRSTHIDNFKHIKTYDKCVEVLNQLSESTNQKSDLDFLIFEAIYNNSIFLLECLKSYYIEKFTLQQFTEALKQKDDHGNTPIHICAIKSYIQCIYYLLENNVDLFEKNSYGLTSFEILKKKDIDILV